MKLVIIPIPVNCNLFVPLDLWMSGDNSCETGYSYPCKLWSIWLLGYLETTITKLVIPIPVNCDLFVI